jgi:hemerythrin superfamily protein
MKATDLLKKQHRKVEAIFKKLESGRSEAAPLVTELSNDLSAHMLIEEEIFYPAVRKVKADLVGESYEEHAVAKYSLSRLIDAKPGDATFKARVTTLKELIEHHVEEEEHELFPKVEKALSAEQLNELGKEMKARFDELVERGYAAALGKKPARKAANGHTARR